MSRSIDIIERIQEIMNTVQFLNQDLSDIDELQAKLVDRRKSIERILNNRVETLKILSEREEFRYP